MHAATEQFDFVLLGKIALGALAAIAFIWLGVTIDRALRGARRSRVARVRGQRASAGERRAGLLLEAAGFELLGAQVPARYPLVVDGQSHSFDVRADYLVAKNGRTWVAEVKTGAVAPRLELPATRRQLLEYGLAFGAAGVLLVDAEADRIAVIELPWLRPRGGSVITPRVSRHAWLMFVFIGSVAIGSVVALVR